MKKILLCICISFIILPIFVRGNQTPSTSSLTNPKTQVNYECEWPTNGVAASSYGGSQEGPQLVGDGEGGVIVAWSDKRSSFSDIYAQKINSTGSPQWDDNGTAICTETNHQLAPHIISDGAGGAYVAWHDDRSGDRNIYINWINATGDIKWGSGLLVCNAVGTQEWVYTIPDGQGGIILVWQDWRNGNQDIYAQRVNSSGTPLWTPNGVGVCNYSNAQIDEQVISDGNGGAIFCWKDQRLGHDIYAQRINGSGIPKWTLNGTVISNATGIQKYPTIATDGSGGAIITWQDTRSSSEYHVYTQRIDANGINQWIPNGTLICDAFNVASGTDVYPKIVSDGSGGAIIGWLDKRNTGYKGIYTQKINSAGESQWTTNGVKVYEDDTNDKKKHEITSDGKGGAILIWEHGHFSTCDIAIGAINSDGSVDDPTSALIICNADDVQQYPRITTDSNGNVFSAWQDNRDLNIDIYVMKLEQLPAKQLEGEEEDDEDDKEEPAAISFGWAFLAISIAVISVITYKKFKKF